ncbi:MAG: ABC transporter substrate-binding protein [Desulfovibrionaceae bacterium]
MKFPFRRISLCILCFMLSVPALGFAADKPIIRTSGQPCLHGMPLWYADKAETGWMKNAPFQNKFMLFASGAPQIEALAADQWDAGAMGAIPAMLASMRYGAYIVGVSNDESETNDLWVRPDSPLLKTKGANPQHPDLYGTKDDWKGKKVLATTVSTGHYALTQTLKVLGLKDSDVSIVHMEQGQAITGFNAGEGDIIQLWAPFSYIGESKGWKKVSSGKRAGAVVIGPIIVRKEFADKNPALVVEWLDIYMRGIEMMKNDPQKSAPILLSYFTDYCGMELTKDMGGLEFKLRPLYTVQEEIDILTKPDMLAKWMDGVAKFMLDQGRISKKEYDRYVKSHYGIEPKFMKMLIEKRAAAAK